MNVSWVASSAASRSRSMRRHTANTRSSWARISCSKASISPRRYRSIRTASTSARSLTGQRYRSAEAVDHAGYARAGMSAHHRPQPGDEGILVADRAQGGEELVEVGGGGMDDAEPTNSIAEAGNVGDHGGGRPAAGGQPRRRLDGAGL